MLPEEEARRLAAAERLTVAPGIQMNGLGNTPSLAGDDITCLVGSRDNLEPTPAALEHLWHERKLVQTAMLVESREYLFAAAHFDPITDTERQARDPRLGFRAKTDVNPLLVACCASRLVRANGSANRSGKTTKANGLASARRSPIRKADS